MSILFFFGAGASYGSEKDITSTPALGVDLFQALRARFPLTWGKLDLKFGDHFRKDFENGMNLVLAQNPQEVFGLQRDMAHYFFDFAPSPDNLYIRIIERLGIKNISFASLNYDRLLEESILSLGFSPKYNLETKTKKEINLCLPHGCSNLFLMDIDIPPGLLETTCVDDVFDSSDIKAIRDREEFRSELRSRALPPIMACFNPKKDAPVGKLFLEAQKERFKQMVRSAELIVIVGIQVREHDDHIWTPLERTSAKIIYCSGENGAKLFKKWRDKSRAEKKDLILPGYFADHFEEICGRVKCF